MAGEMFGIPVGLQAYQDDQSKLRQLASQESRAATAIALDNAQIQNLAADNARADAEAARKADEAKTAASVREALGRLARGEPASGDVPATPVLAGGTPFDKLLAQGARQVQYLQSIGDVDGAAKALKQLTGGVQDLAQARLHASAERENEIDTETKRYEFTSKILSGAVDQRSYDQARMAIASNPLFTAEDLQGMPAKFDPRFVRGAIAGSNAAKQKADLEREAARDAVLKKNSEDEVEHRRLTRALEERRIQLAEEREARLEKQGEGRGSAANDKPIAPPNSREVEMVRADLKRLGWKVGTSQSALISDIAEQVKTLIDGNPGLSREEASSRVLAEMQERGDLVQTRIGTDKYNPKAGSVTVPLPTPKTAAELKKGYYYLDAEDGLVKLFDGKGFKVVTKRRRTDTGKGN